MHWCANVVCGEEGVCGAVLLRALEPLWGLDQMWQARPAAKKPTDLCNGPAKLTQALGIAKQYNGCELRSDADGLSSQATPSPSPVFILTTALHRQPDLWLVRGLESPLARTSHGVGMCQTTPRFQVGF